MIIFFVDEKFSEEIWLWESNICGLKILSDH